jgi:hypothetical protein
MSLELTQKAVRQLNNKIKLNIQAVKISASKTEIGKLQAANRFPPNKDITSYVISTHPRNKFNDINRFYDVMSKGAKWWDKKFIYVAPQGSNNERIAEAAVMAKAITETKTLAYPQNYSSSGPRRTASTGHLSRSIRTWVNGTETTTPASSIQNSSGVALFELVNTAEYGSTAEARAVYVTRQNGLIFYAANRVQRKFPELGIMFRFAKAADFGLPHIYNVPVLTIGSPEQVNGPWVRPGGNIRKERKRNRRMATAAERIRRKFSG